MQLFPQLLQGIGVVAVVIAADGEIPVDEHEARTVGNQDSRRLSLFLMPGMMGVRTGRQKPENPLADGLGGERGLLGRIAQAKAFERQVFDFFFLTCEKKPARTVRTELARIVRKLRRLIMRGVRGDGELPEILVCGERLLKPPHLGGLKRTGILTPRVDEVRHPDFFR